MNREASWDSIVSSAVSKASPLPAADHESTQTRIDRKYSISIQDHASSLDWDASSVFSDSASTIVASQGKHLSGGDWPIIGKSSERHDLNAVVGPDMMLATTEISTIPCAGTCISYGPLCGLMVWRLVVEQARPSKFTRSTPSVVLNFILDTGTTISRIPPEAVAMLGYSAMSPGDTINLNIQGISTPCVVASHGEAARLSGQFLVVGGLAFYADTTLGAPVLYAGASDRPPHFDIPRTVDAPTGKGLMRLLVKFFSK